MLFRSVKNPLFIFAPTLLNWGDVWDAQHPRQRTRGGMPPHSAVSCHNMQIQVGMGRCVRCTPPQPRKGTNEGRISPPIVGFAPCSAHPGWDRVMWGKRVGIREEQACFGHLGRFGAHSGVGQVEERPYMYDASDERVLGTWMGKVPRQECS